MKIVAEVEFLSTLEGGRSQAIPEGVHLRCPVKFPGRLFHNDCQFEFHGHGAVRPGQTVKATFLFLRPDGVFPILRVGLGFTLWEGKTIARGRIVELGQ